MRPVPLILASIALLAVFWSWREPSLKDSLPLRGQLVAHALGAIDGNVKSNSREAFLHAYAGGTLWMEVDLSLTKDGVVVCFHRSHLRDIGAKRPVERMTAAEFLQHRFKGRYTLLTLRDLLALMQTHPDVTLVTDTKGWSPKMVEAVTRTLAEHPDLARRVIPQLYRPEDEAPVFASRTQGWRFPLAILTLYLSRLSDEEVLAYAKERPLIPIIVMPTGRARPEFVRALHEAGKLVMVHTVNDHGQMLALARGGIDGFYTDDYLPYWTEFPQYGYEQARARLDRRPSPSRPARSP